MVRVHCLSDYINLTRPRLHDELKNPMWLVVVVTYQLRDRVEVCLSRVPSFAH